jgi:hypothetical protein
MNEADWRETRAVARAEAAKMTAAVRDAEEDGVVTMRAGQFRTLAALLERLAAQPAPQLLRMDAPIDGVRFWVPLPEFARIRAHADAAIEEKGRLEAELSMVRWSS